MNDTLGKIFGMPVVSDDALGKDEFRLEYVTPFDPFPKLGDPPYVETFPRGLVRYRTMTREQVEAEFGQPPKATG